MGTRAKALAIILFPALLAGATRVVSPTGETAWNVFRRTSDGVLVHVEISTAAYAALGLAGAGQPVRGGAVWVYSYRGPLFNTADRRFVDGDAFDVGGAVIAQIDGGNYILPGAKVQGGIVVSTVTYRDVEVRPDGEIVLRSTETAPLGQERSTR